MAEYTRRRAPGAWHDKPTLDSPIDAQFLEGVEVALDKMLGKDTPNNGDVPTWVTASGGVLWSPPAPTSAGTSGTLSARPSAASASGLFYLATDQNVLYFSNGTTWARIGIPAGATQMWFSATPPTGYIAYDGTALPSSTGIYADLSSHLGGTATPDTRGRVVVGLGSHADVDVIGDNDGVAVASRRVKHAHAATGLTFTGTAGNTGNDTPDHSHGATVDATGTGNAFASGNGVTHNGTGNTGGASARHAHPFTPAGTIGGSLGAAGMTDGPAWITFLFIAKL